MASEPLVYRKVDSFSWWIKSKKPTKELVWEQKLWIFQQTLICSAVCFGVNFGLVTLTYYGNPPPKLFDWPSPVAGSFAVTVFLEITLNWFINTSLMSWEVIRGVVPPLDPLAIGWWPDTNSRWHWWTTTSDLVLMPVEPRSLCRRILHSHWRSLPWMVYVGLTLLPAFTAVTYALWGLDGYNSFPLPELLVGVFGVLIAVMTVPIWAVMALATIGSRILDEMPESHI